MSRFVLNRLREGRIWRRIWRERLVEPLHLNFASLLVAAFGGLRTKIDYDLVLRPNHAWGLLRAADMASSLDVKKLVAIEFGVANGAGLMNLVDVARRVTEETGVEFSVVGFDTGAGMPPPVDVRDHPEHYFQGDYPLQDRDKLLSMLPENARIVFGDLADTLPSFLSEVEEPIGFVSFDVDYYWSSVEAMKVLLGDVSLYLPWVILYFDDIQYDTHNPFAGQLLAIDDFNRLQQPRKIARIDALAETRLFRRSRWIHQMYMAHVFDHPVREQALTKQGGVVLSNPYF